MILDYSEYTERCGSHGIVLYENVDTNRDLFYEQRQCPFCTDSQLERIHQREKKSYPDWLFGSFEEYELVVRCERCGWWQYEYRNQSDAAPDGIVASDKRIVTAVLKEYQESDKNIPVHVLSEYINKNPEKIYSIHDKAMEKLVKSVFEDYYSCDVELVGKSHDGGKDLIMIDSDEKTFIQVKRRMSSSKVESVKEVRELLGASYSDDVKSCVFVSTADHFSKDAVELAKKVVKSKKCDRFDLIDCKSFLDMLQLTRQDHTEIWKTLIKMKE